MGKDDLLRTDRQAIADYRLAMGLELKARRNGHYDLAELSRLSQIPVDSLRSYEKGGSQPPLVRLARLAHIYGVSAFDLLISTAQYIYRAHGEAIPDVQTMPADRIALRALVLYCGVTPAQLHAIESGPRTRPDPRRA